ncbi:AAA family ATPase [Ruminococcus sp. AM31-15AC]|uniref:AAA family ATPase n=1 Tax=Ruminococcus sp. AM31-15AC TaxID=2293202 RepID=UPI0026B94DC7
MREITDEVKKVIIGKDEVVDMVFAAILAQGHVLMEDVPGVGKTTLAVAFSKALGLKQRGYSSPLILWLPTSQAIRLLTDRRRALLSTAVRQ